MLFSAFFQNQMPTSFSFNMAFDLFFKIHFVFNIHYSDSIKSMMEFIEAFIYESGNVDTTDEMDQIWESLKQRISTGQAWCVKIAKWLQFRFDSIIFILKKFSVIFPFLLTLSTYQMHQCCDISLLFFQEPKLTEKNILLKEISKII